MDENLRSEFIKTLLRIRESKYRFLTGKNVSWVELMLLIKLEADGNVSGVSDMLHITKPAVTYMLNSFEEDGYITRGTDPNDRRKIDIKLTAKGKKFIETHKNSYEGFFNDVLAKFGDRKIKEFIRLFNKFADVMDEVKEKRENE